MEHHVGSRQVSEQLKHTVHDTLETGYKKTAFKNNLAIRVEQMGVLYPVCSVLLLFILFFASVASHHERVNET